MIKQRTDSFGFLNLDCEIQFDCGIIRPVVSFKGNLEYIERISHKDGFLYPPVIQQYKGKYDKRIKEVRPVEEIPNSERPSLYYHVPISHELTIENPLAESIRFGDAGLIINLLAFLYGTRLQFHDWRLDGRVPVLKSCGDIAYSVIEFQDTRERFVNHVYCQWRGWDEKCRLRYVNILFMHSRTICLENKWEEFASGYMVFDALFRLHRDLGRKGFGKKGDDGNHQQRLPGMLGFYGLANDKDGLLEKIYRQRNELFHEALWAGETPGQCEGEGLSFYLNRLNARLIVAIAEFDNQYIRSPWWTFGQKIFE